MAVCTPRWPAGCAGLEVVRKSKALIFLLIFFFGFFPSLNAKPRSRRDDAAQVRIAAQVYADKGFDHFYNGEFQEAAEAYRQAIEIDRQDPLSWTGLADSYLFQVLLEAGRLDSELYTASNEFVAAPQITPDPKLVQAMLDALKAARDVCEVRLRANPRDAWANYALAVSYASESSYLLTVARRYFDALSAGGKARDFALKALAGDPELHDANIVLGAYQYSIGSVPAVFRWVLILGGHSGTKARGVALIQDAMLRGKRTAPAALTLLGVIYSREKLFTYSRDMWQHMSRFYPRNFLYELEIARTYQSEQNLGAALDTYKSVSRKTESGAPGYSRVNAGRLDFQIAALLERKDRAGEALAYYARVASHESSDRVVQAHSFLRMGDIQRAMQQKEKAREMYGKARSLNVPDVRREANARLRTLR